MNRRPSEAKSNGHARSDIDTIGWGTDAATSSSATNVARATDDRNLATNAAVAATSEGSPS